MNVRQMFRAGTAIGVLLAANAFAADAPADHSAKHGNAVFQHSCAPCHGYGGGDDGRKLLPAPTALTLKYKGAKSPYLEERDDLPYPVLVTFVRYGTWSMPGFRKTEVTDDDVQAIAAYLAESSKAAAAKKAAAGR